MAIQRLEDLPKVLQKRKAEMYRLVTGMTQKAALAAGEHLVRSTPVKRGIARSNWVATVDVPFDHVIPAYHPFPDPLDDHTAAPVGRFHETQNYASAVGQHLVAAARFNSEANTAIIIKNNAEHILPLNQGRSKQNPVPGWFEQSVEVARRAIQGVWRLKP